MKSLVAIGPAVISVVFGILSIQKTIQRNRIESFILHLKQQFDQSCFYSQYRGWQDACFNMASCLHQKCLMQPRCIDVAKEKLRSMPIRARLHHQPNLFDFIVLTCYSLTYLLSLCTTVSLLFMGGASNQGNNTSLIFSIAVISSCVTLLLSALFIVGVCRIWFGTYSFAASYIIWAHILHNCVPFHPDNLTK